MRRFLQGFLAIQMTEIINIMTAVTAMKTSVFEDDIEDGRETNKFRSQSEFLDANTRPDGSAKVTMAIAPTVALLVVRQCTAELGKTETFEKQEIEGRKIS